MSDLSEKTRNLARVLGLMPVLLAVGACHSVPKLPTMPDSEYKQSIRNVPYAAATPMRDLNIGTKRIPDQLATLQNPYGTDTHRSCAAILAEVRALDEALQRNQRSNPGTIHRRDTRAGNVGNALDVGTKAVATSLIPFRGVVRFASGATYRDKKALEADKRGRERMGFLIGVGSANGCPGFKASGRLR
ncbi:hypothetical protein [Fretibacter rubidus]|uniref:hypothetical protein n=1 Tax=Fretibacter rubidus TaxID=570162 RepID=UPI00352A58B6